MDPTDGLSRRERQIMQAIFSQGKATAKEVVASISDPPSRTAVRTMLTILVEKGLLTFERVGREYVYSPKRSREKASRGALKNILDTFFGGSIEKLIASHFSDPDSAIDDQSLQRIRDMLENAEKQPGKTKGASGAKNAKGAKRKSKRKGKS